MTSLQTKILICGAGPTGLMMAVQLRRFGVECIIIDPKPGIVKESRALAVQARSMQIYEQMGLANLAIEQGTPANRIKLIINGKREYEIPLQKLGQDQSAYPFLFVLEQNRNEKILYGHLQSRGGEVHWEHSLQNFAQNEEGVTARVASPQGEIEIRANWLIGADGASSAVRHQLAIPFSGGTYENIFIVADTHAEWPWGHDCLSICLASRGFTGLFPMKGENRFRVIATFPEKFLPADVKDFSQIQKEVAKQVKIDVPFTGTEWFSVYHVHHRSVSRFSHGPVFLAGDAAHIHSPAGGQGMNTGLQDAYNLAWKMALVVKEQADKKILDSYDLERRPVALRLVKTTDRAFTLITSGNRFFKFLRLYIIPPLMRSLISISSFGRLMYRAVSQIGIEYSASFLSQQENNNLLDAGRLVPFVSFNGKLVDEHLKFAGLSILLFDTVISDAQKNDLQQSFGIDMQFIDIGRAGNDEAFKKFRVRSSALFLIRPDNYIGFASESISLPALKNYLQERLSLLEQA